LPHEFQAQASRGEIFADVGLTDRTIARQITRRRLETAVKAKTRRLELK
jgi:hypothetical protein